jgi:hypothetical protein
LSDQLIIVLIVILNRSYSAIALDVELFGSELAAGLGAAMRCCKLTTANKVIKNRATLRQVTLRYCKGKYFNKFTDDTPKIFSRQNAMHLAIS